METTHDESTDAAPAADPPAPEPEAPDLADLEPDRLEAITAAVLKSLGVGDAPLPVAVAPEPESPLVRYSPAEREAIREVLGGGQFTDGHLAFILRTAERMELDVMAGQLTAWLQPTKNGPKLVMMTTIHGLRLVAERTGKLEAQWGPEYMTSDGNWVTEWIPELLAGEKYPLAARFTVKHRDQTEPVTTVATWSEFAQRFNNGDLTPMWSAKPSFMLGKVAEALAKRAVFPAELSGVYTEDEINTAAALVDEDVTDGRPGRDHPIVMGLEAEIEGLPIEAREKIEEWWATRYVPQVIRKPFNSIGRLTPDAETGLSAISRFAPGSRHLDKIAEILAKASASVAEAAAGEPAETSPTGPPSGGDQDQPDPAPPAGDDGPPDAPTPPPSDAVEGASVYTAAGLDESEAFVLGALDTITMGTEAEIATALNITPSVSFRTTVAAMFEADLIELVPDDEVPEGREQGRGPHRIYRTSPGVLTPTTIENPRNQPPPDPETEDE